MDEIKVSVLCTVYNHEKYLRNCLDGIVEQKTNFKYELLVHDDASTDNSAKIIKEYELKYPDIVKPIYQTENQYSKKPAGGIINNFLVPKAKGRYFAICEGDDFWTDENKLQMQFDYMEQNDDCFLVATDGIINDMVIGEQYYQERSKKDRDFSLSECILGGGGLFLTCSFFMRKEVKTTMPACFNCESIGDYQIPFYAAVLGRVHYIAKATCQYNYGVAGSWSVNQNINTQIKLNNELIDMLGRIDIYYNHKYEKILDRRKRQLEYDLCLLKQDYKKAYKEYKDIFDENGIKHKIKVYVGVFFPKILAFILKYKRKVIKTKLG